MYLSAAEAEDIIHSILPACNGGVDEVDLVLLRPLASLAVLSDFTNGLNPLFLIHRDASA